MTFRDDLLATEVDGLATSPRSRESASQVPLRSLAQIAAQPATSSIYELLDAPQIPWTDWSISAAMAIELADYLERSRPKHVLEIGSGVSTIILAAYADRYQNDVTVTTLEHDRKYHRKTERALKELRLADRIELRYAPLRQQRFNIGGSPHSYAWYDTELEGEFDFVFVDGPPMKKGREVVYFAIADHLASGWEIWLDDGRRDHESQCVALWQEHFRGHFYCRKKDIDGKGVWILRQQPDHGKLFDVGILADGDTSFLEQVIEALRPYLRHNDAIVTSNALGLTAPSRAFPMTYNALLSYPTQEPRDQAIQRELAKLVQDPRVEHVLYLQQYWLARTLDDDWLGRALDVFTRDSTIDQVHLRHKIDRDVERKQPAGTGEDELGPFEAPIAHEPSLIRADALRACLRENGRSGGERRLSNRQLRTVQLSPGVFSRTYKDGRFLWISNGIRTRALSHGLVRLLTPSRRH